MLECIGELAKALVANLFYKPLYERARQAASGGECKRYILDQRRCFEHFVSLTSFVLGYGVNIQRLDFIEIEFVVLNRLTQPLGQVFGFVLIAGKKRELHARIISEHDDFGRWPEVLTNKALRLHIHLIKL